MDVTESDLLTGEEKCQSSNAFGYILQFVVLYKWIIGNSFVQFGMTNILRPVVNTNVHVRSKLTLRNRSNRSKPAKLGKDPSQLLGNYSTVTK